MRFVFLHGFMGSIRSFDAVAARLPAGARAEALPLYGHGCRLAGCHDFAGEADRLAESIAARAEPVHLVGYSLGGRLALAILVRHPALHRGGPLRRATLIGAHPGYGTEAARQRRRVHDDHLAAELDRLGVGAFLERWRAQPLFAGQSDRVSGDRLAADTRDRLKHRPEELAAALRALSLGRMPPYRGALAELELPVAVVAGELDRKFLKLARAMAAKLPWSTLQVIPRCGHNVPLEAPEKLAAILALPVQKTHGGRPTRHQEPRLHLAALNRSVQE
jgi:2-succinyl-6-hydroxy-2,4-cyclohexadiene-1-carboxylate synthase